MNFYRYYFIVLKRDYLFFVEIHFYLTVNLHLTINESVARRIKKYAEGKKTSVSRIVEEQLESILSTEKSKDEKDNSFKESLDKYAGSIKRDKPIDIKEERDKYLKEKHGI